MWWMLVGSAHFFGQYLTGKDYSYTLISFWSHGSNVSLWCCSRFKSSTMEKPTIFTNRDYDSLDCRPPIKGFNMRVIVDQEVKPGDIFQWTSPNFSRKMNQYQWYEVTTVLDTQDRSTYIKHPRGTNAYKFLCLLEVTPKIVASSYTLETNALNETEEQTV